MSRITIGKAGKRNVDIDIDVLLRTRLLIQANSGGGKSWLLRLIAEQLFGKIPVHILDPEGEFGSLREKFPFVLVGEGGEVAADVRSAGLLAQRLLELRASAVIDLYEAFRSKPLDRRQWVRKYLEALVDAPKKHWKPLIVIVDEAHKFCPQESPKAGTQQEREIINACKDAMIALCTVGRKRRFCAIWATQRLAKLDKDASAELLNRLIGLTFEDVDIERAADMLSIAKEEKREFKQTIRVQEPGNWFAVGRAISKTRILFKAANVLTSHPDIDTTDYAAGPPPTPEKIKALLPKLSDLPKEAEEKARTEAEYKARIRELERELKTKAKAAPTPAFTAKELRVADPRAIERAIRPFRDLLGEVMRLFVKVNATGFDNASLKPEDIQKALEKTAEEIGRLAKAGMQKRVDEFERLKRDTNRLLGRMKVVLGEQNVTVAVDVRHNEPVTVKPSHRPSAPRDGIAFESGELAPYQVEVLEGLAMLEAIGRKESKRALVATSAGKAVRSSTFEKYVANLKSNGLVEYGTGTIRLTERGRSIAPISDEPLTSEELQKKAFHLFSPYQQTLLRELIKAHPDSLTRAELGERSGQASTSSTFEKYVSALRSAEVLEYPDKGHVKAADWLFLE